MAIFQIIFQIGVSLILLLDYNDICIVPCSFTIRADSSEFTEEGFGSINFHLPADEED